MTSSQPPQPPGGSGEHPPGGQPPYGYQPPPPTSAPPQAPPGYGPPPGYAPPPGAQPPPYGGPPQGYNPYAQPSGTGRTTPFDRTRLTVADYVIGAGTVLYLVWAVLPWVSYGGGLYFYGGTISGFGWSGLVTFSFILLLVASAWTVLPAFTDLPVSFPRGWVTLGLAGLAAVLTLIAWISTLTWGFSFWALLGLLTAVAVAGFAFLRLMPDLHNRPALPGPLAGAAQWANQQAPDVAGQFGWGQGGHGAPAGPPPHQQPPYEQPYAPPPPTAPPSAGPTPPTGSGGPPSPGGSTASGTEPHRPGTV